jgi:hypothetical protein
MPAGAGATAAGCSPFPMTMDRLQRRLTMKHAVAAIGAGVVFLGVVLTGCYEPTAFTWYEAGVYKGKHDPLLETLAQDDVPQALEQRLRDVQTDR